MDASKKLIMGAVLAVLGGGGMILGPVLGMADLARPWSFIVGFAVGLAGGMGAALCIVGLIERRNRGPWS